MSAAPNLQAIAGITAALASAPRDLELWWRLAGALDVAGADEAAGEAYAALGSAASDVGSVALATACVLKLRARGADGEAGELLTRIARDHCRGSSRVDTSLRSVPPAPPSRPEDGAATREIPSDLDTAVAAAREAMQRAAAEAARRTPDKVAPTPLVSVLEAKQLTRLVDAMELSEYRRADTIVEFGAPAEELYWLACGNLEVSRGDRLLGELRANSFFGEIALVGGSERTADVRAIDDACVITLPAAEVEVMAAQAPKLAAVIANYARARLLSNVMRTSQLFGRLSRDERRKLLPRFETRLVSEGENLLTEGQLNAHLFVIVAGRCEVRKNDEVVAGLGVGAGVGEMSMLGRKPAIADVVAVEDMVVLQLRREEFDAVAVAHPGLLAEVYKLLVERERQGTDVIEVDADDLVL